MKSHFVVIVENYILISQGFSALVNSFENFKVAYTCCNGNELIIKLQNGRTIPDIVLMDVHLPVLNGIDSTRILKKKYPKINIIALSSDTDESSIINMIRAGACAYLHKGIEKKNLETALKEVVSNQFYCTKRVSNILIKSMNDNTLKTELKQREVDFIKHVCTEMTYREIAGKMFLSPKTIDGYRSHLFNKLNVKNRIGLVLYAIKNNIFIP